MPKRRIKGEMAKVTRVEALLVIKKWFDEQTPVRCDLRFARIAGCLRGRIFKFDGLDLGLISQDARSELSVRISDDATSRIWRISGFPGRSRECRRISLPLWAGTGGSRFRCFFRGHAWVRQAFTIRIPPSLVATFCEAMGTNCSRRARTAGRRYLADTTIVDSA